MDVPAHDSPAGSPILGGAAPVGRLACASIAAFATYAGGAGLTYLAQLAIARAVGPDEYGIYAWVAAWMTVLAYLSAMGFDVSLLRFVSAYRSQRKWALLRGVIRYANRRAACAGVTIVLLGLLGVQFLGDRSRPELKYTLMAGLPLVPIWALLWIRCSIVRALGGVVSALAPDRLARDGFLVLLIGAATLLAGWRINAPLAMAATLLSALPALGIASFAVRRRKSGVVSEAAPEYAAANWRRTVLPLVMIAVSETAMNRTGVVLLGWFGEIRDAGIYALAFNVASLALLPRVALNALFAPMAADAFSRDDRSGLKVLIGRTAWWTFFGAAGVALPVWILADPLLRLLGAGFTEGVPALRILLLGQVFASAAGPQLFLLTMAGYERSAAVLLVSAAVANVVVTGFLVSVAGLNGAAAAAMITLLALNGAMALLIRRKLQLGLGVIAALTLRADRRLAERAPIPRTSDVA